MPFLLGEDYSTLELRSGKWQHLKGMIMKTTIFSLFLFTSSFVVKADEQSSFKGNRSPGLPSSGEVVDCNNESVPEPLNTKLMERLSKKAKGEELPASLQLTVEDCAYILSCEGSADDEPYKLLKPYIQFCRVSPPKPDIKNPSISVDKNVNNEGRRLSAPVGKQETIKSPDAPAITKPK